VKPHKRWQNKTKSDGVARAALEIYELKKLRWEKQMEVVNQ